jgi:acetyl-CoA synthetase (ADP-forming)
MNLIQEALKQGRNALSEYESKKILAEYDIPVTREILVSDEKGLLEACRKIGYPLVLKACSFQIAHKSERGLIRTDIRNDEEALSAFGDISPKMKGVPGGVLVQEMAKGKRELVVGMTRDPQFGPCVMFGLGGIFTEILNDVTFRIAPLTRADALRMMRDIRGAKILDAVRGMEAVDEELLASILINVGRIGVENDAIKEVDINPLILVGSRPVAVDSLIVLDASD